ncbi:MAG: ABC transporter permease [Candidatus Loosdrechtia sp.]|uniref:ABC transporter permease n=1 Tax=Candidatus Loosdrechtia sp. TaxID=3101272 RepID=UPI003A600C47|nr:MAG: ABC transporter permease [Candidatus Jettenia sp. AMX2]
MSNVSNTALTVVKPKKGWKMLNLKELIEYRDLFYFLAWRDIKILYAQTILGLFWVMLKPSMQIIVFTVIFGKVANISTEGIPYFLFSTVAIIPWTYMSQAMQESSQSLVLGQQMLGKVYFPRLIFPLVPILARLVDFAISVVIVLAVMLYYNVPPTLNLLFLPLFIFLMTLIPAAIGLWLSSLAIRFRDVKHAIPFLLQILIYTAPIVYSASTIPEKYRIVYSLNPIVGVIEGFRASLLGTPLPWPFIWPGIIMAIFLFLSGAYYFRRMERIIVDVI